MTKEGIHNLTHAIVLQAVRDWRSLCRGAKETSDCNFKELSIFFKSGCNGYIDEELAKKIYKKLKKEKWNSIF